MLLSVTTYTIAKFIIFKNILLQIPIQKVFAKLVQASDKVAKNQVQHLLVLLAPDGNLQINGATNFVNSLNNNEGLYRHLQTTYTTYKQKISLHLLKFLTILSFPVPHIAESVDHTNGKKRRIGIV